jgi:hypothetical protein
MSNDINPFENGEKEQKGVAARAGEMAAGSWRLKQPYACGKFAQLGGAIRHETYSHSRG